ncbi:MAG: DUF4919 domain-containing protein [Bacteroidales bacterium]|nr:DUF4919 domain-containing protein [Bacteroidales bacterium]
MKHCIMFFLFSLACMEIYSQAPDYETIRRNVVDSTSDSFYPKLMQRYEAFDTTLTVVDYRHLYYGYLFQNNYDSDWNLKDKKTIEKSFRDAKKDKTNYDQVITLVNNSLHEYPFDLRSMQFLCFLYHENDEKKMGEKASRRFISLIGAILSSGDGKSCETAYHVIFPQHEFSILKIFQFESAAQKRVDGCNYLELKENKRGMEGIYFKVPGIEN